MNFSSFLRVAGLAAFVFVAGCSSNFETNYPKPIPAEVASGWRLADIRVTVPGDLTVSEAKSLLPIADIVWREDPPGDRKKQVAKIVSDATRAGAAGLTGQRPVRFDIVMQRFHALTFEAEAWLKQSGVHDISFTIRVVDANSGEVLAGPTPVMAALPALAGAEMAQARLRGESQKSQISLHLQVVIAGWLGLGPDPRGGFTRIGG